MTTLTNEESSIVLAKKAALALIQSAGNDWSEAHRQANQAAALEISVCNLVRRVGLQLIEAAGHEQVSFDFYRNNQHLLPESLTFSAIKKCIHVAKHFDADVSDMNEVRQVQQSLFEAFGLTEPPHRETAQIAHERNWFSDLVSSAASFDSLLRKADRPIQKWERDELKKFVDTVEPIAKRYEEAKGLLR